MDKTLKTFASVALLEGISYIILLVIAMPLKYFFGFPYAVKVVGWAHGVLFVLYVGLLIACWRNYRWSFRRVVYYFVASLLPVVPFLVERNLKKEYARTETADLAGR
jgi:integral membrane protein